MFGSIKAFGAFQLIRFGKAKSSVTLESLSEVVLDCGLAFKLIFILTFTDAYSNLTQMNAATWDEIRRFEETKSIYEQREKRTTLTEINMRKKVNET